MKIKRSIWHSNIDKALEKFYKLYSQVSRKSKDKILALKEYIQNNKDYIVNHDARKDSAKIFAGNLAESKMQKTTTYVAVKRKTTLHLAASKSKYCQ